MAATRAEMRRRSACQRAGSIGRDRPRSVARACSVTSTPAIIASPPTCCPTTGASAAGPSKVRPEAVDGAGRRRPQLPRHSATARPGAGSWSAALRNGLAELFVAARRLRGPARQRRHDRVLGRRHVRPDRRSAASTSCFGEFSSKFAAAAAAAPHLDEPDGDRVRRPARIPRPTAMPGVDAYCLTHNETSTGVAMPLAPARRAPTTRSCWSTPPRPPAACASTRPRSTSTTSRRRSASPSDGGLWLAALLARRRRAHRAHRRERPLGAGVRSTSASRSTTAARTRPTTRRRWPRSSWPTHRSSGCSTTAACEFAAGALRPVGRRSSTAGPRPATTPRRSSPTRRSAATWSARSTSTTRSTPRPVSAVLRRQRHRRHRAATASSAATSCASRMFPAIDPDDVEALTRCIDFVVERLG